MLLSAPNIIRRSFVLYRENSQMYLRYVGLFLIANLLSIPLASVSSLNGFLTTEGPPNFVLFVLLAIGIFIIYTLLNLWFNIAFMRSAAALHVGEPAKSIQERLMESKSLILRGVGASIVVGLYVTVPLLIGLLGYSMLSFAQHVFDINLGADATIFSAFFLLIALYGVFHVLYFSIKIGFTLYFVVLDNKKIKEAMQLSKAAVHGRWWSIFWRIFLPTIAFFVILWVIQIPISLIFSFSDSTLIFILGSLVNIVVSSLIAPLISSSIVILFTEAKKA